MPWKGGTVKKGGSVLSAKETLHFWIRHNSTATVPAITRRFKDLDPQDGSVIRSDLFHKGCNGTEVLFLTVKGGGHTIPSIKHLLRPAVEMIVGRQNHDMESANEAWDFLTRQSRAQ